MLPMPIPGAISRHEPIVSMQHSALNLTSFSSVAKKIAEGVKNRDWREIGEEEIIAGLSAHQREFHQNAKSLVAGLVFEYLIQHAVGKKTDVKTIFDGIPHQNNVSEVSRCFIYLYKILMRSAEANRNENTQLPDFVLELTNNLIRALGKTHLFAFWQDLYEGTDSSSSTSISAYAELLIPNHDEIGDGYHLEMIRFFEALMKKDQYVKQELIQLVPLIKQVFKITPANERTALSKELLEIRKFALPTFMNLTVPKLYERHNVREEENRTARVSPSSKLSTSPSLLSPMFTTNFLDQFAKWSPDTPSIFKVIKLVLLNEENYLHPEKNLDELGRAVKHTLKSVDKWKDKTEMSKFIEDLHSTPVDQRVAKANRSLISQVSDLFTGIQLMESLE